MKRYEQYKDSGIEWIGEIPSHWDVMKVAHLFSNIGSGTTPNTEITDYYSDVNEHFWLQTGDLNDGYIRDTAKYLSDKAIRQLGLNIYPKGSLVVAMYGATIGKLGLLDIETSVNQACCVLSGSKLLLPKFTFYSFLAAKGYLISFSAGGGQPNISQSTIRNHKTSVPQLLEQEAIVEYLDEKCGSIDAVIATQERRIALLSELKQSIITEAVTRGINPDAPLKDSGIEWIGEIPSHWDVKRLKYTASVFNGNSLNDSQKKEYLNCESIDSRPYVASKDIDKDFGSVDYENGMRIPNSVTGFSVADTNTTLLCIEGGSAGKKIAFVNQQVCFVNKLCCINSKINSKYNYFFICSNSFKEPFFRSLQGMIGGVTVGQINNFPVLIPPVEEQEAIVEYLDEKCRSIDSAISKAKREIELLREFKQSVITEAVTGKIKVY